MGGFVQEYAVLRWGIVAGFVLTAVMVAVRFSVVPHGAGGQGISRGVPIADHESDAAHLLMCLVMLAMLVFPMAAAPEALRGVLTAMMVVYAVVLVGRVWIWRQTGRAVAGRAAAIGYHLAAAAAMLWVASGHGMDRPHTTPAVPMLLLAALFTLDAVLMFVPGPRSLLRHAVGHGFTPTAVIPHVVMDVGTAYMLLAAALN